MLGKHVIASFNAAIQSGSARSGELAISSADLRNATTAVVNNATAVVMNSFAQGRSWIIDRQTVLDWACGELPGDACRLENLQGLVLLIVLSSAIVAIICAFAFFREDKEEQITPLCPQLVVRDSDLLFRMPFDTLMEKTTVSAIDERPICKVAIDWPDPMRPGASGVAATVRLQNNQDLTLATVVARNVAVIGQGLALCRAGCDIFGFVEPEGPRRYIVRHRAGVHLLTLTGDFSSIDVVGTNPVGSKVCWFQRLGDECRGRVVPLVDAGLVLCSVLAAVVHQRLVVGSPSAAWTPQACRQITDVDETKRREDAQNALRPGFPGAPSESGDVSHVSHMSGSLDDRSEPGGETRLMDALEDHPAASSSPFGTSMNEESFYSQLGYSTEPPMLRSVPRVGNDILERETQATPEGENTRSPEPPPGSSGES